MNILQVTAALEQGGVERGTVEMATFIVEQGAKSFVASQGGRMVSELEAQGSYHFKLPLAQRNPFTILYSATQLKKIIREKDISLVHARSRAPAWAAYLASRAAGVPFVTTFHGTHRIQNIFKKKYNSIMVSGQRVIAISQFIRNHIIENYGIDDSLIDVAPRGFDPRKFYPGVVEDRQIQELRISLGLKDGVPVISLPGRLTRWKGQLVFLEALGEIADLPWQALIIGGAGKKHDYLEELVTMTKTLGIVDRVKFVGNQPAIIPFYAVSDIVISASTEPEAFGRVAVEAQAMGKPVIASAHGGSLETVKDGETGWLFKNRDANDLAAKMRHALTENVKLEDIGCAARQWVEGHYTTDRMCRAEWESYTRVLNRV